MYTLHTNAKFEDLRELTTLLRTIDPEWRVVMGSTGSGGQRDCFYGWGETFTSTQCENHNLLIAPIPQNDPARVKRIVDVLVELSHQLVKKNIQCVITDSDDWSQVATWSHAILYLDEHRH